MSGKNNKTTKTAGKGTQKVTNGAKNDDDLDDILAEFGDAKGKKDENTNAVDANEDGKQPSKAQLKRQKQKEKAKAAAETGSDTAATVNEQTNANDEKKGKEKEKDKDKAKEKDKDAKEKDKDDKKDKDPKKKNVAALKARLQQQKEEEDRRKKEEEMRKLAEEQEQKRLEEEAKKAEEDRLNRLEARKQKREQLRKEGKLLTKSEREKRERAEAALAIWKEKGMELPGEGVEKKKVSYGKKKGKNKNKARDADGNEDLEEQTPNEPDKSATPAPNAPEEDEEDEKDVDDTALLAEEKALLEEDEDEVVYLEGTDIEKLEAEVAAEEGAAVVDSWDAEDTDFEANEKRKSEKIEQRKKSALEAKRQKHREDKKQKLSSIRQQLQENEQRRKEILAKKAAKAAEKAENAGAQSKDNDDEDEDSASDDETDADDKKSSSSKDEAVYDVTGRRKKKDKRELRSPIIAVLGHVDVGKCWGRGTKLMMYDGTAKKVEDIVAGDQLMGDDSTPRTVQAGSVIHSKGQMYEIQSDNAGRDNWRCNGDHVLVLKNTCRPWPYKDQNIWMIHYVARVPIPETEFATVEERTLLDEHGISLKFADREAATEYINARAANFQPLMFECSISDFLKMSPEMQRGSQMFQPDVVHFPQFGDGLEQRLQFFLGRTPTLAELTLTGWVLGWWISDLFGSGTVIHQINTCEQSGASDRSLNVNRFAEWYGQVEGRRVSANEIVNQTEECTVVNGVEISVVQPLKYLLDSYGLCNNKHVPLSLLTDSVLVRRSVLAGIVDGGGYFQEASNSYEVHSKTEAIAREYIRLARGLGLKTNKMEYVDCTSSSCAEVFCGWRTRISGKQLAQLPMVLSHKLSASESDSSVDPYNAECCDGFKISAVGVAEYFGFTLDGNSRCLLDDFVVTHNTKILDRIRSTNVQEGEMGGITQQIGATFVPRENIEEQTKLLMEENKDVEMRVPGLLIIDTPGHESFTNLRTRGSGLCDIAILVVDLMHGLEQQTIESLNLLKQRKTPFIIALNKVDRCYQWKSVDNAPIQKSLATQGEFVKEEFEKRTRDLLLQMSGQGLNCALYYKNPDVRKYVSVVPTSAHSGEGIPDLLFLLVKLTQSLMTERLSYGINLQCTVLEVKQIEGLGTTIDVILVNGILKEGDTIVLAGMEGPITTQIRSLLTPPPMREIRVKSEYVHHKEVRAAMGVKIAAPGLDNSVAGSQLLVWDREGDLEELKDEVQSDLQSVLSKVDKSGEGVYVMASTLGSLEALLTFLQNSKIPVSAMNIGTVFKADVMKASVMLEKKRPEYSTILAFDVKVAPDAKDLAEKQGVRIFTAGIIYHLFDMVSKYMDEIKAQRKQESAAIAVFPCILAIKKVFNAKNPLVMGVRVVEGVIRVGTPLVIEEWRDDRKDNNRRYLGRITSMETNHTPVTEAKKDVELAIKVEMDRAENQCIYQRHFDDENRLVSKLTRESIDQLKAHFQNEMTQDDWKVVIKLKKFFEIM